MGAGPAGSGRNRSIESGPSWLGVGVLGVLEQEGTVVGRFVCSDSGGPELRVAESQWRRMGRPPEGRAGEWGRNRFHLSAAMGRAGSQVSGGRREATAPPRLSLSFHPPAFLWAARWHQVCRLAGAKLSFQLAPNRPIWPAAHRAPETGEEAPPPRFNLCPAAPKPLGADRFFGLSKGKVQWGAPREAPLEKRPQSNGLAVASRKGRSLALAASWAASWAAQRVGNKWGAQFSTRGECLVHLWPSCVVELV